MKKGRLLRGFYLKANNMVFGSLCLAFAAPPKPAIPNATFAITAYGAMGDGITDNTAAIQAAIDAASGAGGGVVIVPPAAKPYECGPITLASTMNFQISSGATLQCLPYAKYPLNGSAYANFISAANVHDVEISGTGTIDGQGADWWAAFNANGSMPHRPYLIKFNPCTTVYVHDVTLSNSPMFHFAINGSNVTFDGITILAPSTAPNTDGIDPAGSNFLIENCTISTGDDNIAIKPGNNPCRNFTIINCIFGSGHGLSVGGQTNFGLDSLNVSRCTFNGTTNGIRLKANRTNGGLVQHLFYSDITMSTVSYPVLITSYYEEPFSPTDSVQPVTATTPVWKNITIRNLVSTNSTNTAVSLQGLPEMPVQNLTFANAVFTGSKNFSLTHAHGVNFFNTSYNGASTGLSTSPVDATISQLTITTQPQSKTVALGSTLNLSILVTADFTPRFQWFHNNAPLVDIGEVSGVTTASITVTDIQWTDAGGYMVSLSDSTGDILSDTAVVIVKDANAGIRKPIGLPSKKTLPSPIRLYEYIDPSGRRIQGINAATSSAHALYLTCDPSGTWTHRVRIGN